MVIFKQLGLALWHLSCFSPLDSGKNLSNQELSRAAILFPLAGSIFGLGFAGVYIFAAYVVKPFWACLATMMVMVAVFTGRQYRACMELPDFLRAVDSVSRVLQ